MLASDSGVSSVMFDASKLAYDDNVAATKAAVDWAHAHGVLLEAELGEVGGKDGAHAPGVRTDPTRPRTFVSRDRGRRARRGGGQLARDVEPHGQPWTSS